jgi:hypothetical protein
VLLVEQGLARDVEYLRQQLEQLVDALVAERPPPLAEVAPTEAGIGWLAS